MSDADIHRLASLPAACADCGDEVLLGQCCRCGWLYSGLERAPNGWLAACWVRSRRTPVPEPAPLEDRGVETVAHVPRHRKQKR